MSSRVKKIILIVLVAVAICAAIWVGMTVVKNTQRSKVLVVPVSDFTTDDSSAGTQTSGTVTSDSIQKVHISDTQTVTKVYVEEGQTVHKNDKLMDFDTSLGENDLRHAQIALERQEIELKNSKAQLDRLLNAETVDQLQSKRAALEDKLQAARYNEGITDASAKPVLPEGDGSMANPKCVVWDEKNDRLTKSRMNEMLGDKDSAYVLLVSDDGDGYSVYQGLQLYRVSGSDEITVAFVSGLQIPEIEGSNSVKALEAQIAELDEQIADAHTKPELIRMQNEKRREISAAEIDIKIAQVNLRKLKSEIQDGAVYSEIDGTVKTVRDPAEALRDGSAVIEVSGGGGYYIEGAVSELALDTVKPGQSVTVNSHTTGMTYEGKVTEISPYPTNNSAWGDGNPNVSYYPMKVFVDDNADLQDGDYVDMRYSSSGGDTWYLESMFIRSENGKSFVFVRGENGKLEKRTVQTGRNLWGYYTEILSGISTEDNIAFPYGKDVVEGAKTRIGSSNELYGY